MAHTRTLPPLLPLPGRLGATKKHTGKLGLGCTKLDAKVRALNTATEPMQPMQHEAAQGNRRLSASGHNAAVGLCLKQLPICGCWYPGCLPHVQLPARMR